MEEYLSDEQLRDHLNKETGKLEWSELAPHFARGAVITVSAHLDLVEVAAALVRDNKEQLASWMNDGHVKRAVDDDAREWTEKNSMFWAVVAAPWVIVQEVVEN